MGSHVMWKIIFQEKEKFVFEFQQFDEVHVIEYDHARMVFILQIGVGVKRRE